VQSAPTASWTRCACSWSPALTDRSRVSVSDAVSTMSIATTMLPAAPTAVVIRPSAVMSDAGIRSRITNE